MKTNIDIDIDNINILLCYVVAQQYIDLYPLIQNIHQLWSVPLRCIATLILLYYQIGYIFFIGLGFSIIMIFINQYIGNFIGRVNKDFMAAKDKRIRLVTDIIFSMKQIKMQAWESIFGQKINELRKDELNQLRFVFKIDYK